MTSNEAFSPEKAQSAYRDLSVAAKNLNQVSDELGKTILVLDAALQKLNLGVSAWVRIAGEDDGNGNYWGRDIGYAKVGGEWGIALRTLRGNYNWEEDEAEEKWLFNDGPRWLRADAIEHIPALLEKLTKQADDTAKRIQKKTEEAKQLAAAVKAASTAAQAPARKS
jgi:hypothetical protein